MTTKEPPTSGQMELFRARDFLKGWCELQRPARFYQRFDLGTCAEYGEVHAEVESCYERDQTRVTLVRSDDWAVIFTARFSPVGRGNWRMESNQRDEKKVGKPWKFPVTFTDLETFARFYFDTKLVEKAAQSSDAFSGWRESAHRQVERSTREMVAV